jgi:ethanolamine ammonia-lyase large subunit
VRLREKFGYKVNDAMWDFYKKIQIVGPDGKYTEHFGDPIWVYYQYRLAKGDKRGKDAIYAEGEKKIKEVTDRGVWIARGYGKTYGDLNPKLAAEIDKVYQDAKVGLWVEWDPAYIKKNIPNAVEVATNSKDREDYISHPASGEELSPTAVASLEKLRDGWAGKAPDVQIVISDGLDTRALMDDGHLEPFLNELQKDLKAAGLTVGDKTIVVSNGRVRAGYQVGDILFAKADPSKPKAVLHVIGERPGTGHHQFSVYISAPKAKVWAEKKCDHDITKVVCGMANTAADPAEGAKTTVKILKEMIGT